MTTNINGDTGVSAVQAGAVQQGDLASDALGAALLANNGYQKLPNGLIIQWGAVDLLPNGAQTDIQLPLPWTVGLLNVVGSHFGSNPKSVSFQAATGLPLEYLFGYSSDTITRTAYWIAIGK
jgi:hypothetical protein